MKKFGRARSAHLKLGRRGEDIALNYLMAMGYSPVMRNWKVAAGELDLVVSRDNEICFVEVKSIRRNRRGFTPEMNLSRRQRRRNYNTGRLFVQALDVPELIARFYLVGITFDEKGRKVVSIDVLKDYLPEIIPEQIKKIISYDKNRHGNPSGTPPLPWWRKILRFYNFQSCPLCVSGDGKGIGTFCDDCLKKIRFMPPRGVCKMCGSDLNLPDDPDFCFACKSEEKKPIWKENHAIFEHDGNGRLAVLLFKYCSRIEFSEIFAAMAADVLKQTDIHPDVVVPVPQHFFKYLIRGYNQADLFASCLAGKLHVPRQKVLVRTRIGKKQASLNRKIRIQNAKGIFACSKPGSLKGKHVLLVDDVFTTGSTAAAAAKALLLAEPEAIYLLTISRRPKIFQKRPFFARTQKNVKKIKPHTAPLNTESPAAKELMP